MEHGYKRIFWGFLITIFDINLGRINILPDFIGYYIVASGISILYKEFQNINLKRASSLAYLLMCYSLIMGIAKYVTGTNSIGNGLHG